jgi:hypothetical protein
MVSDKTSDKAVTLYDPKNDPRFQNPYVDIEEWRERSGIRYYYMHGGFAGAETRFSFYFPEKEMYQGRFFHFMAPLQGSENASQALEGIEDRITFSIKHGAYFVESNMGVSAAFAAIPEPQMIYQASAAVAEYSREQAAKLYGPNFPYGYIFGGSGGGYKTISCFENTNAWDGAAPFVIGTPMTIPSGQTVRSHARRILRNKLPAVADAIEPGGGDMYEGLNQEEREALEEATRMGCPVRAWLFYKTMTDGSLPVLKPAITAMDPSFFDDFWETPGYLGADPGGSAIRDRLQHCTAIKQLHVPGLTTSENEGQTDEKTGVDDAWQRLLRGDDGLDSRPWIELDKAPPGNAYLAGLKAIIESGGARGTEFNVDSINGNHIVLDAVLERGELLEKMAKVRPGDAISLDNSDYIALQTYHRHQVPDRSYTIWDQFRDENGNPRYPQRPLLVGPLISRGGSGSQQSGRFNGKMIMLSALMDLPWESHWYRTLAKKYLGKDEEDRFRLYYIDYALHSDSAEPQAALYSVSYLGALYQNLLYLSDWVEKGIAPPAGDNYTVTDGQVSIPITAEARGGIQPVINLKVNGAGQAVVKPNEEAHFYAEVALPVGTGILTAAEWSFEGESDFPVKGEFVHMRGDGIFAELNAVHRFSKPGIYFPVLRVSSNRQASEEPARLPEDQFTKIKNLGRVRVVCTDGAGT